MAIDAGLVDKLRIMRGHAARCSNTETANSFMDIIEIIEGLKPDARIPAAMTFIKNRGDLLDTNVNGWFVPSYIQQELSTLGDVLHALQLCENDRYRNCEK